MKHITIIREKKKFVGSLIPYDCFLNVNYNDFKQYLFEEENTKNRTYGEFCNEIETRFLKNSSSRTFNIANGKSVELEISNRQNELFVVAFTSTGPALSDLLIIEEGQLNTSYVIKTDYSLKKGTTITLHAI